MAVRGGLLTARAFEIGHRDGKGSALASGPWAPNSLKCRCQLNRRLLSTLSLCPTLVWLWAGAGGASADEGAQGLVRACPGSPSVQHLLRVELKVNSRARRGPGLSQDDPS